MPCGQPRAIKTFESPLKSDLAVSIWGTLSAGFLCSWDRSVGFGRGNAGGGGSGKEAESGCCMLWFG